MENGTKISALTCLKGDAPAISFKPMLNAVAPACISNVTGEGIKALTPYQKNESGNKESGYRRKIIFVFRKRDKSTCKICGSPAHNVHHILSKKEYPHWKRDFNNLISLCFDCHNKADKNYFSLDYLFNLI